jgi:hypothetical protein
MFYNRKGEPITPEEWGKLHEDPVQRRVAEDTIGTIYVSTAWLGIDHGIGRRRLIFETMTFDEEGTGELQDRYSTEAEALAGHRAAVLRLLKDAN